jgi:hypothetical protein
LAFTTTRGAAGVDFVGTDAVDVLFSLNETGDITVDAKGGNDTVTVADADGVVGTVTIKGGAGNDVIIATDSDGGTPARFSSADVKGGLGNDSITSAGAVSSKIRGNEGADDFALSSNYTDVTINGNSGVDSFSIAATGIVLSNAKILGGSDNDQQMNFTAGAITAVDSTINGGKGVDGIQIGTVTSATNFTVFGGQGNDVITSVNAGSDSVVYSGDKGADQITTGGAKDSISGGDDNDIISAGGDSDTVSGGEGNDIINGEAGTDSITGDVGNDTLNGGAAADTVTGGLGADTITTGEAAANSFVYSTVSDSAATLTGTSNGFDTFSNDTDALETVDLKAVALILAGNTLASDAALAGDALLVEAGDNVNSFAQLASFLNNNSGVADRTLDASGGADGAARLLVQSLAIADGAGTGSIAGNYIIVNNSNGIYDAGDMMFEIATLDGTIADALATFVTSADLSV